MLLVTKSNESGMTTESEMCHLHQRQQDPFPLVCLLSIEMRHGRQARDWNSLPSQVSIMGFSLERMISLIQPKDFGKVATTSLGWLFRGKIRIIL